MKKYVLAVLAAGCLWGTMGFFTRTLATIGIDAEGAILVRCAMAALCFAVTILVTNRAAFRVRPKDFWCFFGRGVCALLAELPAGNAAGHGRGGLSDDRTPRGKQ